MTDQEAIQRLVARHSPAVQDLEVAALGHLAGGDWDKEMREAIGEMKDAREAISAIKKEPTTDG